MIIILCIIAGILLIAALFPKLFWAFHNRSTARLQGSHIEGVNDLEWKYGQDSVSETEIYTIVLHEDGSWSEVSSAPENAGELEGESAKEDAGELERASYYSAEIEAQTVNADLEVTFICPKEINDTTESLTWPAVVWANGTGNTNENYLASLTSLASYGFIVMGCNDQNMGDGSTQYRMGEYLLQLNEDPDSIFYRKIDIDHIGAGGHSQGGCSAVNAVTRFEKSKTLFSSLFTTSLPKKEMCVDSKNYKFAYWDYDMTEISVPYFATSGTWFLDANWISPLSSMEENFAALDPNLEAYRARQKKANHNIVNEYHGCGYFNAWFCYTLKGDAEAAEVFTGSTELKQNTGRWMDFYSK